MSEATVLTKVKIDVNPQGISFSLEGIDSDLAKLIESANSFTAEPVSIRSFDTADITISSTKAILFVPKPPKLAISTSALGSDVVIGFPATPSWETSITEVSVGNTKLSSGQYTVTPGNITILNSVFTPLGTGAHTLCIKATGFMDNVATLTLV